MEATATSLSSLSIPLTFVSAHMSWLGRTPRQRAHPNRVCPSSTVPNPKGVLFPSSLNCSSCPASVRFIQPTSPSCNFPNQTDWIRVKCAWVRWVMIQSQTAHVKAKREKMFTWRTARRCVALCAFKSVRDRGGQNEIGGEGRW